MSVPTEKLDLVSVVSTGHPETQAPETNPEQFPVFETATRASKAFDIPPAIG
jgi:hypothetical protein